MEASSNWVGTIKNYSTVSKKWVGKCPFSIKVKQKSEWALAHPAHPAPTPLYYDEFNTSNLYSYFYFSSGKVAEYNAEDINGDSGKDGGYYPAMADYSLPFSMANIWKKKADELGNFNAMEHLALMEKIEQMQKYNGSVVYSGPPSPPRMPTLPHLVNGHNLESPKKPKTKPASPPKEKKFIAPPNGVNQTPVGDYENQIKNDIWPLDCIKCNSLLGNLDNFNLHMNDHWSDDKCCPVCGLLINSKRFNFKQHLKIHTGEKPFTCNVCNRSFRQKAHMVKHVTTHSNIPRNNPVAAPPIMALEAK